MLNPGSREAQAAGCICPVIDNHYGAGYYGISGVFVMREDCPIHGGEFEPEAMQLSDMQKEEEVSQACQEALQP